MTTPYSTGTVSVTAGSTIAKGVGTGWKTAGLVAGIFGLDSANGNPVPVLSVDSDTQITFAKPWRGATANDQPYWITYDTTDGQQTVNLMEKVIEYIARLNKPMLTALASLVPAADKLPYVGAGGAGALADFPAAARALLASGVLTSGPLDGTVGRISKVGDFGLGAPIRNVLSEVADLNALQNTGIYPFNEATQNSPGSFGMVLHIARYPTSEQIQLAFRSEEGIMHFRRRFGGANGAWQPWREVYNSGRLSQLIERGNNANGEYVRLADGTQISFRSFVTGAPTIQPGGYAYLTSSGAPLPAAFTYAMQFVSYNGGWAPHALANYANNTLTNAGELYLKNTDTAAHEFNGYIFILTVGRWF